MTQLSQNPKTALPDYLGSDHVSARTRHILAARIVSLDAPQHISGRAYGVLRIICQDLLPCDSIPGTEGVDLASMVDNGLGGKRDGWRYAELPPDRQAYEAGLLTLDDLAQERQGASYAALPGPQRVALLDVVTHGQAGLETAGRLRPAQMKLWVADLRADIVTVFLSHPVVQEALGISAVMTGGDNVFQGFSEVGPDSREGFEPRGVLEEVRS